MMTKKKVLITGGLGFIGVHCVERWKDEGWDICVVDNKSANTVDSLFDGVEIIESNLLDLDWKDLPKVDLVLHLAAPVGPVGVLKHSGTMAKLILEDIYWAIEGAKYNNCPLVHISTSEIYGYREDKSYLSEVGDKFFMEIILLEMNMLLQNFFLRLLLVIEQRLIQILDIKSLDHLM